MRVVLQFSACLALGLVLGVLLLIGLMFTGRFELIELWLLTGKPLAQLALMLLPDAWWSALSGVADASRNGSVQSFLQFCVALGQAALLLAAGFFRLWYRR
jgi:hypothetical protein